MSVVGFDLGHQTCFIAVARQGGIETIANEYSDRCTPAYVSLGPTQRFMGASAKNQLMANIKNTVWGWKKMIGRQFRDPVVTSERAILPYEVIELPDGSTGIKVQYLQEGQTFSPNQVTAMMLTKLKDTAAAALQTKVVDCVISVPCYFTDAQRYAMLDASRIAGLNCLRLMNDTTATALAYGIYKQDLPAPDDKPRHVVFIDLGHADLQVAAAAFNKGKLKILATSSDSMLGGRDFDAILAKHFAVEFRTRYGIDATKNGRAWTRLLGECEKLKKLMSANSTELPINIECFMQDKDVTARMKREDMEAMAAPLFARAKATMEAILKNANLKLSDVDAVEVVGGSCRIPAIKQLVHTVFGKEPSTTLNGDEAVGRGCALQCAILSPTFRVRDFVITDCQPYAITLCWQAAMEEDSTAEVFGQFHAVPFSKMLTFYRREPFVLEARYSNPPCVPFPNPILGVFTVDNVVPQADNTNSKVKVKLRVNLHGIFKVASASMLEKPDQSVEDMETNSEPNGPEDVGMPSGADNDLAGVNTATTDTTSTETTGEEEAMQTEESQEKENKEKTPKKKKVVSKVIDLPVNSSVPQLSAVELNLRVEKEGQMIAQDRLEKERMDAKNNVEEYVYEMRDKLSGSLEKFVKEKDREKLQSLLSSTENWLYEEGEDEKKQVYLDKLAQLKKLGQPIQDRYWEAEMRPAAMQELGQALQLMRKTIESYDSQDERYAHIEAKDMDKVRKCVAEKTEWFEKNHNLFSKLPPYENPAVHVSAIRSQKDGLYSTCNPIISKPKPKPKETPPASSDEKTDKGEGDSQNSDESVPKAQTDLPQPPAAGDQIDMELD